MANTPDVVFHVDRCRVSKASPTPRGATDTMPATVLRSLNQSAMSEIRQLRKLCWAPLYEAGYSLDDEFDDLAIHWAVHLDGQIVAAARLTIHNDLTLVPDRHLFRNMASHPFPCPIGYMSRLIIHPRMRGKGLTGVLDRIRIEAAIGAGCQAMVCSWTPMSGKKRREQLLRIGFKSPDGDTAHQDEGFGVSFILYMPLPLGLLERTSLEHTV
jgi:hypothetical protein